MIELMFIIKYLVLGVVFAVLVDISTWHAERKGIKIPPKAMWGTGERIAAILLWPLGVISFVSGYIKARFIDKK